MAKDHKHKARLLIVEDDDALADLMQEYLSMNLFEISRVASGEAGVEAIFETQPHLVILDLMLPGMNGLDVCRQVRDAYSGAILMLTASQSEADHVAGLELGADVGPEVGTGVGVLVVVVDVVDVVGVRVAVGAAVGA